MIDVRWLPAGWLTLARGRARQVISRHDPDCPGASPIMDCPPGSGAWFDVVVERYACTQEALRALATLPATQRSGGDGK